MKKVASVVAIVVFAVGMVITQSEGAFDALINFDFALACDGCMKAVSDFDFAVACDGCMKAIGDFDFGVACDGCMKVIDGEFANLS